MKYLTLMISLVTLFLSCAKTNKLPDMIRTIEIQDTGEKKGAVIKFSAYKLGKRDSILQFECNCDSIVLSDSDFSLIEAAKKIFKEVSMDFSFTTYDGKINFVSLLAGGDEIRGYFPEDSFLTNDKIYLHVHKAVSVDTTIQINNERFNTIKEVRKELLEEEYSMVNKLFNHIKPLMLKYGVKEITNRYGKGFKTKSMAFQYKPELLISCDPKNDYVKIFGDWCIIMLNNIVN